MFGGGQIAGQMPRPKSLPIYISWYINGYGRPWTSSDVNPKIRPLHGQIAGTGGVLLATTDHMHPPGRCHEALGCDHDLRAIVAP
jgi:hypothetical protein